MSRTGILAVSLAAALEAACLVQVTHVADPGPVFREALAEASRYAGRPGPAREINVLVWDPSDRQLVRVCAPLWLIRAREVDWDDDENEEWHEDGVDG